MIFANPGLSKRRPRIGRKPAAAKKQRNGEVVNKCDVCGTPIGRTCSRDSGSYICAVGDGVPAMSIFHRLEDGTAGYSFSYFCSTECRDAYAQELLSCG